jgi:hypothetical protein
LVDIADLIYILALLHPAVVTTLLFYLQLVIGQPKILLCEKKRNTTHTYSTMKQENWGRGTFFTLIPNILKYNTTLAIRNKKIKLYENTD